MIDLVKTAKVVQDFCQSKKWKFCFIGGLALQRWGEPRVTKDVDLTILTHFKDEEKYIDALLTKFKARTEDAKNFALIQRVLLLQSNTNIGIDISLAGFPYEERIIERATYFEYIPGTSLLTCSAEDLIALKAFASRHQDWADVQGIILRSSEKLNWPQIIEELTWLAEIKEEPEIVDKLLKLKDEIDKLD